MAKESTTTTYVVEITEELLALLDGMFTSRSPVHLFLCTLLSQPVQMNALIRHLGPAEIVEMLDDKLPVILDSEMRSEILQGRKCDVRAMFTCKPLLGGPKRMQVVVEIKPKPTPKGPLQVTAYCVVSLEEYGHGGAENMRNTHFPFGMLLNCSRKIWDEAVSTDETIEGNKYVPEKWQWKMPNHLLDIVLHEPDYFVGSDPTFSACFYATCFCLRRSGPPEECFSRSYRILGNAESHMRVMLAWFIIVLYIDDGWEPAELLPVLQKEFPGKGEAFMQPVLNRYEQRLAQTMAPKFRAEGKAEGKTEMLLRQMQLKYRSVPESRVAQVRGASQEQLDIWVSRILAAPDLDSMFEDSGGEGGPTINGDPAGKSGERWSEE